MNAFICKHSGSGSEKHMVAIWVFDGISTAGTVLMFYIWCLFSGVTVECQLGGLEKKVIVEFMKWVLCLRIMLHYIPLLPNKYFSNLILIVMEINNSMTLYVGGYYDIVKLTGCEIIKINCTSNASTATVPVTTPIITCPVL